MRRLCSEGRVGAEKAAALAMASSASLRSWRRWKWRRRRADELGLAASRTRPAYCRDG
jgi:hypothetical protein